MELKDIPEVPVLEFLLKVERGETFWTEDVCRGGRRVPHGTATWYCSDTPPENSVVLGMPEDVTGKMARLKMGKMIRKGLVSGCPCGCRGDFEITPKGREFVAAAADSARNPD